jgi:hypothetical protein
MTNLKAVFVPSSLKETPFTMPQKKRDGRDLRNPTPGDLGEQDLRCYIHNMIICSYIFVRVHVLTGGASRTMAGLAVRTGDRSFPE